MNRPRSQIVADFREHAGTRFTPPMMDCMVSKKATGGCMDRGLPRLTYTTTDLDWRHGGGPDVAGPVEALALATTRRPVRLDELTGPGADSLRAWATRAI